MYHIDTWAAAEACVVVPANIPRPTRPFGWSEVQEIVRPGGDVTVLGRSAADLVRYIKFKAHVLQEYEDMEAYVWATVFGYPLTREVTTGKLCAVRPASPGSRTIFRNNDFPYYLSGKREARRVFFPVLRTSIQSRVNFNVPVVQRMYSYRCLSGVLLSLVLIRSARCALDIHLRLWLQSQNCRGH